MVRDLSALPGTRKATSHAGTGYGGSAALRYALWAHPDSNQGPTGYEPAALPLSSDHKM